MADPPPPLYPETWRTLVVSHNTDTIKYRPPTEPLQSHPINALSVQAFQDYEALRRRREAWLDIRVEGESQFLRFAADYADEEDRLDPPPELAPLGDVIFGTLLLPQSMSHGWLTRRDGDTNGKRVWEGMARYDAALLICMHACFQVTDTVVVRPDAGNSPAEWLLHKMDFTAPIGPANQLAGPDASLQQRLANPANGPAPLDAVENMTPMAGLALLRMLFETFTPAALAPNYKIMVWNTLRYWVAVMLSEAPDDSARAEWLLRRARSGLLAHYVRDGTPIASTFPSEDALIYGEWNEMIPDAAEPQGAAHTFKREALQIVHEIINNTPPQWIWPMIQYDRRRRAGSVFYAPAVAPLVIVTACAATYLRAMVDGNVLPGTNAPGTEVPVPTIRPLQNVGLRALTSYTLARLHATLGGNVADPFQNDHAPQWTPSDMGDAARARIADTAHHLTHVWNDSNEPDRRTWIRALEAGLLIMCGERQ